MGEGIDGAAFERLLAQSGWMRALALDLVGERAAAEDLVQEAWVAALRSPPRGVGSTRAFLARVLANLSRARHRSEAARREREERTARGEALPSAADVVERAASGRRLVEHVLALEEPYRSTVLSRYFDGLSAERIAARDVVPSSTVRTRLQRGLAQLRARLVREEGRAWAAWIGALAGRAKLPSAAGAAAGAIVMGTVLKVGIGAAFVAAVAWVLWPEREPAPPGTEPIARIDPPAQLARVTPPAERVALAPIVEPEETAPGPEERTEPTRAELEALATEVPPFTIEGIVLRGREPVTSGTAWCWPGWDPLPERPDEGWTGPGRNERWESLMRTELDGEGRFRFAGLQPCDAGERYRVGVDLGDGPRCETWVEVLADRPSERVVVLLGTSRIVGHVHDDEGRPVAGKWVEVSTDPVRGAHGAFFTGRRTDEQGAFAIDELTSSYHWLTLRASKRDWEDDLMQLVPRLAEAETRVVDVGRPVRATVWSGTVRARTGDFVSGPGQIAVDDTATQAHREVPFDERGRFRAALQPGTYEVRVMQGSLHRDAKLPPVTIGETDVELDLVVPGARLRGSVRDRSGVPWSYATAAVEVRIHPEGHDYPSAHLQLDAAEDGSFLFDALESGAWLLDTSFVRIEDNARVEVPGPGIRGQRFVVLEGELEVLLELELEAP